MPTINISHLNAILKRARKFGHLFVAIFSMTISTTIKTAFRYCNKLSQERGCSRTNSTASITG
jgi:hypothetical protein